MRGRFRAIPALISGIAIFAMPWVSVLAADPSQPGQPSQPGLKGDARPGLPWTDSAFRSCGVACTYEKANENLSLEALYILKKLAALKNASDFRTTIQNNLAEFCLSTEPNQKSGQSRERACYERYLRVQVGILKRIRTAIVANSDMAGALRTQKVRPEDATVPVVSVEPSDAETPRIPQVPYLPTYEDLQEEYRRGRALTSPEYERWAKSVPREPARDDFVKFREIPRDPENPEGEKMVIVDSNRDGTPKYDDVAFQAALARYREDKAIYDRDLEGMLGYRVPATRPPEMNDSVVAAESKTAFNHARGVMVVTTNRALVQGGAVPREMSFTSAGRASGSSTVTPTSDAQAAFDGAERVRPVQPTTQGRDVYVAAAPADLDTEIGKLDRELRTAHGH